MFVFLALISDNVYIILMFWVVFFKGIYNVSLPSCLDYLLLLALLFCLFVLGMVGVVNTKPDCIVYTQAEETCGCKDCEIRPKMYRSSHRWDENAKSCKSIVEFSAVSIIVFLSLICVLCSSAGIYTGISILIIFRVFAWN